MKAFYEITWFDFEKSHINQIKDEIRSQKKEYILSVDEETFIEYIYQKYALEPIKILTDSEHISEPHKRIESVPDWRGVLYNTETYTFTIQYNFTGTADLFKVQPTPYRMITHDISVNGVRNTVSFSFRMIDKNPEEFQQKKQSAYNNAFANIDDLNGNVNKLMNELRHNIQDYFNRIKSELKSENDFFAAINVKVNEQTSSVFSVPTIKKKIIPQAPIAAQQEFSSSPTMSKKMYDDILKVIYDLGKAIEKKPTLFKGKDEEALRDQFVLMLETRYVGITSTGETFNKNGKTDILLKYADDGTNVFIAECKIWKGAKKYGEAINQLFDRYLTWRDSKVAIILFVQNKDFTSVLTEIESATKAHTYYSKNAGKRGESSFSYIFHLPDDTAKEVFLEVIAFNYAE